MEAQEGSKAEEYIKKMKAEFEKNNPVDAMRNIKEMGNGLLGVIKEELAAGNIHNAQMIKDNLTKYVSIEELNKMMVNLEKMYKR